jgi:hypothetical protein
MKTKTYTKTNTKTYTFQDGEVRFFVGPDRQVVAEEFAAALKVAGWGECEINVGFESVYVDLSECDGTIAFPSAVNENWERRGVVVQD